MWETIYDGSEIRDESMALVVGTSSKGIIGKEVIINNFSDIRDIFGSGEMPDRIIDIQSTMGSGYMIAIRTESDTICNVDGVELETSSFEVIKDTIEKTLDSYLLDFVFIAQSVDAEFVTKLGVLSEELFKKNTPVLFITETSLDPSKLFTESIVEKQAEFEKVDARFVSVVCQPLENGKSASGLCVGHVFKSRVNQSIGATNFFSVSQDKLPSRWMNFNSRALDKSRFITLRVYAGLQNLFWANGRTMASDKSDYRFTEVVRTVFKARRLIGKALLSYHCVAADENLIDHVGKVINAMVTSNPKELDSYNIECEIDNKNKYGHNTIMSITLTLSDIPLISPITFSYGIKFKYIDS